jgi:hypothetical protein
VYPEAATVKVCTAVPFWLIDPSNVSVDRMGVTVGLVTDVVEESPQANAVTDRAARIEKPKRLAV